MSIGSIRITKITVLVEPHGSGRLADDDRDRFGLASDRGGGPVSGAETLGHREVFVRHLQHLAAPLDHAVAADDKRSIQLSDFFGVLLDFPVEQVAVLLVVAAERIDTTIVGVIEHLAGVTNDEQRANRFALASFTTDLGRQVDHGLDRFQRNAAFEHLQITTGQTPHPLVQLQMADRIEPSLLESAVHRHHFAVGANQLVGSRFQQGMLETLQAAEISPCSGPAASVPLLPPPPDPPENRRRRSPVRSIPSAISAIRFQSVEPSNSNNKASAFRSFSRANRGGDHRRVVFGQSLRRHRWANHMG